MRGRPSAALRDDFHAADETVFDEVDVLDLLVDEKIAGEIVDDLVDLDDDAAVGGGAEFYRLDVRIEHLELARPVFADGLVSVDTTAFHAIWPVDVGVHRGQHRVDLATIELVVDAAQELDFIRHGIYRLKGSVPIYFSAKVGANEWH